MPNDLIPEVASTWTDNINLPKILGGPAGEAISRLIGHAIKIPASKIQQVSQGIKDKTEARSIVSRAIANEAAKHLTNDQALVQRAADSFLAKELRRQTNKEAVASETIKLLTADQPSTATDDAAPPEDDWMNLFERFAEDASSERLRTMWAKILAGEIRAPKSYSLRTLRFIAELDQDTASHFEELCDAILNDNWIPRFEEFRQGPLFTRNLLLEEAGLLSGVSGQTAQIFSLKQPGAIPLRLQDNSYLFVNFSAAKELRFNALLLTRTGQEIAKIVQRPPDEAKLMQIAEFFRKDGVASVSHLTRKEDDAAQLQVRKVLWSSEEPKA